MTEKQLDSVTGLLQPKKRLDMSYVYLACPYSVTKWDIERAQNVATFHNSKFFKEQYKKDLLRVRANMADHAMYRLIQEGLIVYSPISHTHRMGMRFDLPKEFGFWQTKCEIFLSKASFMVIDRSEENWKHSKGIYMELQMAKGLSIKCLDVEDIMNREKKIDAFSFCSLHGKTADYFLSRMEISNG